MFWLQTRNPGCWFFKFGDLKFEPSLFQHGKKTSQASVYQVAHFSAFFNEMPFTEPPLSPTSLPDSLKWKVIPKRGCLGTKNLLPFLKKVDARWWFFLDFRHELNNNKISWLVNLPTSEIADLVIRANWKPMEFTLFFRPAMQNPYFSGIFAIRKLLENGESRRVLRGPRMLDRHLFQGVAKGLIPSGKLTGNGKCAFWRCIPYPQMRIFQPAMLA